jgi:ATP-dependent Clp protease ATP-binding subunit ClpA
VASTESEQRVLAAVEEAMPPAGQKALRGHIAFRPESKEVIEQARRAAVDLGHDWVGTEHTLLGLIRVAESPAARILRNLGCTPDELHASVTAGIDRRIAAQDKQ